MFPFFSDTLLKTTADALGKWKDLLRNYTKTVDEEVYDSISY
jgi:translation initiation factor eIF-2B subunit epsilon